VSGSDGVLTWLATDTALASSQAAPSSTITGTAPTTTQEATTTEGMPPESTTTGTGTTSGTSYGPVCGTVAGGGDTYHAQLIVHADRDVSCATAISVIKTLAIGNAQIHPSPIPVESRFSVAGGWKCSYSQMGGQTCQKGNSEIMTISPSG
jgi:hypothetical protein